MMARGFVYAGINMPELLVEVTPVGLDRAPIFR
jgi:hypothetical protein